MTEAGWWLWVLKFIKAGKSEFHRVGGMGDQFDQVAKRPPIGRGADD